MSRFRFKCFRLSAVPLPMHPLQRGTLCDYRRQLLHSGCVVVSDLPGRVLRIRETSGNPGFPVSIWPEARHVNDMQPLVLVDPILVSQRNGDTPSLFDDLPSLPGTVSSQRIEM